MSEIIFAIRGNKDRVDNFITDLQKKSFWRIYNKQKIEIKGSLKPIQLYGYSFPEAYTQQVVKMIAPKENCDAPVEKFGFIIRKLLGAKKIPKWDGKRRVPNLVVRRRFLQIWGLGLKKDRYLDGEEQI